MYKIHLNNGYTGVYMSVPFTKGIGETDNEYLAERFECKGYTVEKIKPAPKPKQKE